MKNLEVKKLRSNNRNFTHISIHKDEDESLIHLRGVSKITGEVQWYDSKEKYSKKEAKNILKNGEYQEVLSEGITKSTFKNWHRTKQELETQKIELEKLSKKELINLIISLSD